MKQHFGYRNNKHLTLNSVSIEWILWEYTKTKYPKN